MISSYQVQSGVHVDRVHFLILTETTVKFVKSGYKMLLRFGRQHRRDRYTQTLPNPIRAKMFLLLCIFPSRMQFHFLTVYLNHA